MNAFAKAGMTGAAVMALMIGMSAPAAAAETMCGTGDMGKGIETHANTDDMMDDTMMDDTMMDDGMAKDDMASDDMMEDDMMDEGMAKDDLAMSEDTMSDDAMMHDGDMTMGTYTVKKGDSLWKIAAVTLCDGDRYPEIVAANKDMLGSAMMVHPGDKLMIPGD